MSILTVKAHEDHFVELCKATPMTALAELIWNALDADATNIKIAVERNALGAVSTIRVEDNGIGMDLLPTKSCFSFLGHSWKKNTLQTHQKRSMHGKQGQGRYKALALGNTVLWETHFQQGDEIKTFSLKMDSNERKKIDFSEPQISSRKYTGTAVAITNPPTEFQKFDDVDDVVLELSQIFALYLRNYPGIRIEFMGKLVDPSAMEKDVQEIGLEDFTFQDGTTYSASMTIIEWRRQQFGRHLYFCDEHGFSLHKTKPGVQAPEIPYFSAYVKTPASRVLDDTAGFAFDEGGHPDYDAILGVAKKSLRKYVRERKARAAADLVQQWKAEKIYPYEKSPETPTAQAEQQVFDIVAKSVSDFLPDFEQKDHKTKLLSFKLLQHAVETSPSSVRRILQEVFDLPEERKTELAELLDQTSLSKIIELSSFVSNRLNFLHGLEILIYDTEAKDKLLERSQLQHILEEQTWIFGEQFTLSVADQNLNVVLQKHIASLKRDSECDFKEKVLRSDGKKGIVDLMLSREIPCSDPKYKEHLVIEIKRPKQNISEGILHQTKSYAKAVAYDERFRDTNTKWFFWAVSNDFTKGAKEDIRQGGRLPGQYWISEDMNIEVWAKPWSLIIREAKARLEYCKSKLDLVPTDASAVRYLHAIHEKYLPDVAALKVPTVEKPGATRPNV